MHTGYIKYVSIIPWAGDRTLLPVHFLKQKHIFQPFFSLHCNPTCFQHFLSLIRYTVISVGHIFQPFHSSTHHTVIPAGNNIQHSHLSTQHKVKILIMYIFSALLLIHILNCNHSFFQSFLSSNFSTILRPYLSFMQYTVVNSRHTVFSALSSSTLGKLFWSSTLVSLHFHPSWLSNLPFLYTVIATGIIFSTHLFTSFLHCIPCWAFFQLFLSQMLYTFISEGHSFNFSILTLFTL